MNNKYSVTKVVKRHVIHMSLEVGNELQITAAQN